MASSFLRFLDHTQRRHQVSRTLPDECSARGRDLYLATHNAQNKQISMFPFFFNFKIRLSPYDCYISFCPFSFSQDSLPPYHLSLACLSFPLYALILLPLLLCSLCSSVILLLLSHMLGCASLTHSFLFVLSGGGLRS